MRAALAFTCLVVAANPVAAEPRDVVDELPELAKVSRNRIRVVVRGHVTQKSAMVTLVEQVVADVERRFLVTKGTAHPEITLALFSDGKRYKKVAAEFGPSPSDLGFYMPGVRIALANVGYSVGNLRHEMVHPMIDDDFPACPAWLNEGLGSLYGTARWNKDHFDFLINYRLKDLQRALRADTLPTFDELARSTWKEVHGPDASVYYALGRYILVYLDRKGTLSTFYADMRAATGNTTAQAKLLAKYIDEKQFHAWAKALRL